MNNVAKKLPVLKHGYFISNFNLAAQFQNGHPRFVSLDLDTSQFN